MKVYERKFLVILMTVFLLFGSLGLEAFAEAELQGLKSKTVENTEGQMKRTSQSTDATKKQDTRDAEKNNKKNIKRKESTKKPIKEGAGLNPDHIKEPEKATPKPIIKDKKEDPYLGENLSPRLFRAFTTRNVPEPGKVELSKIAEPVKGKLNTFKVTLRMETTDKEQKNDIILVMDRSGSMQGSRMANAKKAAKQFVNQLLDANHPSTRIALVSFASNVTLNANYTNYTNKQQLLNAIEDLEARGGTFTQGGLKLARDMLASSSADFKNMVFLSDGEPTYGYTIHTPDNYLSSQYIDEATPGTTLFNNTHSVKDNRNTTTSGVPENQFDYNDGTVSGTGYAMFHRYYKDGIWSSTNDKYYNFGNSAVAEAGFAKSKGVTVHSIAMGAGTLGTPVLQNTASAGHFHNTNDPEELSGIFDKIAANIASAMKAASVTDPMGAGFEVKGGTAANIHVSQGTATLNNDSNTISWNVGTLSTPVSPGSMTRFAEMTYEVEVNDSILNVVSSNGQYNTNDGAQVKYTDIDGKPQTKAFPEPKATPLLIGFYKELLDSQGKPVPEAEAKNRTFTYNMKLNEDGSNKDYIVKAGSPKVMTDLRIDKKYTFTEKSVSGTPSSSLSDYKTDIRWKTFDGTKQGEVTGTTLNDFVVPKDNSNKPLNTRITVINREKADGILKITKKFTPVRPRPARPVSRAAKMRSGVLPNKFELKIKGVGYDGTTEVYNKSKEIAVGETLTLENLPYGTYTVKETDGDKYHALYKDDADHNTNVVKVSIDKKMRAMTITNHPEEGDDKTEVKAKKKWVNGPETDHTAPIFDLYADGVKKDGVTPVITPTSGTADEFDYKWTNLQKYNADGSAIVYTVKEAGVSDGNKLTVNGNTYSVTQNANTVTNTYMQPSNGKVKATKIWEDPTGKTLAKPEVNLTLYRKTAGGAEEQVPATEAEVKVVDEATTTAEWTGLKSKDINGNDYIFIVKESFRNAGDVNNDNWTLVPSTEVKNGTAAIINKSVKPVGKLIVTKNLLKTGKDAKSAVRGGGSEPVKFKFKVTGPSGYEETFELAPGESKELSELYFGEYKVTETDSKGYTATYSVADGKVMLTASNAKGSVEVTNSIGAGTASVVDVEATKTWVGGPKSDHKAIELALIRKSAKTGSKPQTINAIPEITGKAPKFTYKWKDLAKHDAYGFEYNYSVEEMGVKSGKVLINTNTYAVTQKGNDITNTFVPPAPVKVDPPVRKQVTGNPKRDDMFTFTMKAVSNNAGVSPMPMPAAAGSAKSMTAKVYGSGKVEFGEYKFTKEGTYIYEITEACGKLKGYTYDSSKYIVKHVVTKKENVLYAKTTITRNGKSVKEALFVNKYNAGDGNNGKIKTGDDTPFSLYAAGLLMSVLILIFLGKNKYFRR
ncbi:MAG: Cna B-type domain-containing protein [Hornefia sp.]|nr:Cna B-type domain-containing protein [Hornefia sp.]